MLETGGWISAVGFAGVEAPMTRLPESSRLTAMPEMVTLGPPAVMGVPPILKEVGWR